VSVSEFFDGLEFHHYFVFHKKVKDVCTNKHSLVMNRHLHLTLDLQSPQCQLVR